MSTGASCRFYEKTPHQWFYDLQCYPYGETEDRETFGPFETFRKAYNHLHANHANPGGFWTEALPGCQHDLLRARDFDPELPAECDRCGHDLTPEEVAKADVRVRRFKKKREPTRNIFGLPLGQLPPDPWGLMR